MMMNCFSGMADRRNAFSLIFSCDYCKIFSPLQIYGTPQAYLEPAQNLNSGFFEWCGEVVITTKPQHQGQLCFNRHIKNFCVWCSEFLKLCISLAFLNFCIRVTVKLYVIKTFILFWFFFFWDTFFDHFIIQSLR